MTNTGSLMRILLARLLLAVCLVGPMQSLADRLPTRATEQQRVLHEAWEIIDKYYPLLERKGLNWPQVYDRYATKVTRSSDDEDLFNLFQVIMDRELRDGHSGIIYEDEYEASYSQDLGGVSAHIAETVTPRFIAFRDNSERNEYLAYGIFAANPEIGYIMSRGFEPLREGEAEFRRYERQVDRAFLSLATAKAIVVDLRLNGGGQAEFAYYLAGRFLHSDLPRDFVRQRVREGRGLSGWITRDYHGERDRRAEGGHVGAILPDDHRPVRTGSFQYLAPVVVLTSGDTGSAAEFFTAAMRSQPHVTTMGTRTFGIFAGSDTFTLNAGNGKWQLRISVHDTEILYNGRHRSFEGVGIEPDVLVEATEADLSRQQDPQLAAALRHLLSQ